MTSELPRITIRLDRITLAKLRILAKKNFRPLSMEALMILSRYIAAYEEKHGEIKVDD